MVRVLSLKDYVFRSRVSLGWSTPQRTWTQRKREGSSWPTPRVSMYYVRRAREYTTRLRRNVSSAFFGPLLCSLLGLELQLGLLAGDLGGALSLALLGDAAGFHALGDPALAVLSLIHSDLLV